MHIFPSLIHFVRPPSFAQAFFSIFYWNMQATQEGSGKGIDRHSQEENKSACAKIIFNSHVQELWPSTFHKI